MKVTFPVAGSTVKVPFPEIVTEVCVQLFGVSAGFTPHNFSVAGKSGKFVFVMSLANGLKVCWASIAPLDVFGFATGAAGNPTVTAIVESTNRPMESVAWYLIGVAGPVKVGKGSKVTAPVTASTE